MTGWKRRAVALVSAALMSAPAGMWLTACAGTVAAGPGTPAPSSQFGSAPAACVGPAEATRHDIEGTLVWARFCPGAAGRTAPAEVPSDALTTHLDLLGGLVEHGTPVGERCGDPWGPTYRVQLGYADGRVATIVGTTDPDCDGRLAGDGTTVSGPDRLGVYGSVMAAFGRQHADASEHSTSNAPLVCPDDPREPDSVDVDGASASSDTGYLLGRRAPMTMPLTAVRGIVCTWPFRREDEEPVVRDLSAAEAERVRIGLHAIAGGVVDCGGSRDPTNTAVVEDRTGTRRAVTVLGSECSTVLRSDKGYGLGFAWLDR